VAVCDYGAGNVSSVLAAFARLGADVCIAETADAVAWADLAVLPGVGSAASAMAVLRERGLDEALPARVAGGAPTLGICLGLQLALQRSDGADRCSSASARNTAAAGAIRWSSARSAPTPAPTSWSSST